MMKPLALVLALMIAFSTAGCGKVTPSAGQIPALASNTPKSTPKPSKAIGGKLIVWSFSDEIQKMIENYAKADLPDIEFEFVMVPSDSYQSKLKAALQSGQDAPDVFALEQSYIKNYPDTGLLLDLSDMLPKAQAVKMAQYPIDMAMDSNGKIRAYSWQCTPGAFFYRRSLARRYLGTDDPTQVQDMVNNVSSFLATARKLYDGSGGTVKMVTNGDLFSPFKAGRRYGWVVDGRLIIDQNMISLVTLQKDLHDRKLDNCAYPWDSSWFACMNDTFKDDKGNPVYTFGYFLPTWGIHYVLKQNCENKQDGKFIGTTYGDWAMVKGPFGYFAGGTWLAVYVNSPNPGTAKSFIEYVTMNEKFEEKWAIDQGDFVSSMNVVNRIKDIYSEPFLGGQNHYALFAAMIDSINGSTMTGYDQEIDKFWEDNMMQYIDGKTTLDEALKAFRAAVASQFPEVMVK